MRRAVFTPRRSRVLPRHGAARTAAHDGSVVRAEVVAELVGQVRRLDAAAAQGDDCAGLGDVTDAEEPTALWDDHDPLAAAPRRAQRFAPPGAAAAKPGPLQERAPDSTRRAEPTTPNAVESKSQFNLISSKLTYWARRLDGPRGGPSSPATHPAHPLLRHAARSTSAGCARSRMGRLARKRCEDGDRVRDRPRGTRMAA
mmetsp:Transcript_23051/g.77812  ORF Transcript_23051/g.77812 Transcript_23051/m.77812 type:complete len:200 (-) Transcript_23051:56-655(-)